MESDFPRALCHQDELDQRIQEWEMKYSTPVNDDDVAEIMAGLHAELEDCDCDCCMAA